MGSSPVGSQNRIKAPPTVYKPSKSGVPRIMNSGRSGAEANLAHSHRDRSGEYRSEVSDGELSADSDGQCANRILKKLGEPVTPLGPRGNGGAAHPAVEAKLRSHLFPAVALLHVGSARPCPKSREADPAHGNSRNPAGPVVGVSHSAR